MKSAQGVKAGARSSRKRRIGTGDMRGSPGSPAPSPPCKSGRRPRARSLAGGLRLVTEGYLRAYARQPARGPSKGLVAVVVVCVSLLCVLWVVRFSRLWLLLLSWLLLML